MISKYFEWSMSSVVYVTVVCSPDVLVRRRSNIIIEPPHEPQPCCYCFEVPVGYWWRSVVLGNGCSPTRNQSNSSYSCDMEISSGTTIDRLSERNKFTRGACDGEFDQSCPWMNALVIASDHWLDCRCPPAASSTRPMQCSLRLPIPT